MELLVVFLAQWILFCLSSIEGRPVSLSSSGEPRRYSLDELEELMKELQQQGAIPIPAGTLALEPAVLAETYRSNSRNENRGQAQRIKKKLSKLEKIFRKAYGNPGSVFKGDTVYSLRRWDRMRFDFDPAKYTNIISAKLRLYKLPLKAKLRPKGLGSLSTKVHILNTPQKTSFLSGATLVDSQSVRLSKSGWITFDITAAVRQWLSSSRAQILDTNTVHVSELTASSLSITKQYLEIWVESTEVGRKAAKTTRNTRFVQTRSRKHPERRPQVELFYTQS